MPFDSVVLDDYSRTFSVYRTRLVGPNGQRYADFVRELRPRYWIVYRDIAAGYLFLVLSCGLTAAAPHWGVPPLVAAILGAVLIGYCVAYLQLFIHEAAHYNLTPARSANDRLCDLTVSWMIGTTVAAYRSVHFQHHRNLGTTNDTEFTYFLPLNWMFLLKAVLGIRALDVFLSRLRSPAKAEKAPAGNGPGAAALRSILGGMIVHGSIVGASLLAGWWWVALAWMLAIGFAFPFFGALRQLLEHRDETASAGTDYSKQNHGAYTRLFDDGLLAATFGGAGFNRHLLHHWEPQVSYTNLAQLEAFLARTEVRTIMDARRSTYLGAVARLFSRT
jgi:fatty acid desaturase